MNPRIGRLGAAALLAAAWAPRAARAQSDALLFHDLAAAQRVNLSKSADLQRFLNTIAVEKLRIQDRMLHGTLDTALELYHDGQYDAAGAIATRILEIDPGFQDAQMLREAAGQLKGSKGRFRSERRFLDEKFKDGLDLYQKNRLLEAERRFDEVVKLSPGHLKARYWLRRVQGEIAEIHYAKGLESYKSGQLQRTLDHWYAALLLNPHYPKLVPSIQKVEADKRRRDANRLMQRAVVLHGADKVKESLKVMEEVLALNPGDPKAQALNDEMRLDVARRYVADGRRDYKGRKFDEAIKNWRRAIKWGYAKEKGRALISRAKEMKRKEKQAKEAAAELARKKEEDEARKKEEEDLKKLEEESKEGGGYKFGLDTPKEGEKAKKSVGGLDILGAGGKKDTSEAQKNRVTEAHRRQAMKHYQSGMVFMQNRQIERAKSELEQAKKLDPANMEVDAALRRIDAVIAGQ